MPDNYQWLKLWHGARTDAKLRALSGDQHRVWLHLLIFASEQQGEQQQRGAIIGYEDDLLAIEVADGDIDLMHATIERLVRFRMLDRIEGGYQFITFNKRQADTRKPSDQPEETRRRQQVSRAQRRDTEDDFTLSRGVTPLSRGVTPLSRGVTPLSRGVTPQEEEEEEERDREIEEETTATARADVAATTHTPMRTAAHSGSSGSDTSVVSLCEQVATQAKLPQRPDLMAQLSAVLRSHMARGLSPGDIWRDVLNLTDPSRPKSVKRPSISQISNWLSRTKPAVDLAAIAASNASNGHISHSGGASNGYHANGHSGQAGYNGQSRRRQPDLPDPTRNGQYAHLVTVASDDDPDET